MIGARLCLASALAAVVCLGAATASASQQLGSTVMPPLPASIAALGDSISQGFDAFGKTVSAHLADSWSTGKAPAVKSQYLRVLAANPAIAGHSYNFAQTGAQVASLSAQAARAVAVKAQYVTILIGADDLCANSARLMTPLSRYATSFGSAMAVLERGLPTSAHIFVASIPNLATLWRTEKANPTAKFVWAYADLCLDMLGSSSTASERREVLTREFAFNSAMAAICARWANCHSDRLALFDYRFVASQVSSLDFFHPSVSGQALIASVTWARSWWPSLR